MEAVRAGFPRAQAEGGVRHGRRRHQERESAQGGRRRRYPALHRFQRELGLLLGPDGTEEDEEDAIHLAMAEQPVPWAVDGMARLRQKTGIPVFADESAVELKHLMEIVQKNAADGFFIKIPKAGGLLEKAQESDNHRQGRRIARNLRLHDGLGPRIGRLYAPFGGRRVDIQVRPGEHGSPPCPRHLRHGERTHNERHSPQRAQVREGFSLPPNRSRSRHRA